MYNYTSDMTGYQVYLPVEKVTAHGDDRINQVVAEEKARRTTYLERLKNRPTFSYKAGWQDHIPAALKGQAHWIVWKFEYIDGRWTKVPYQPAAPKSKASTTEPAHWTDFATAVQVYERLKGTPDAVDGVGYVFSHGDEYVGGDLDNCFVGGVLQPWAVAYLNRLLPTYAERSPSGKGIKFIAKGTLPGTGTRHVIKGSTQGAAIELYDVARFFTITGDVYGEDNDEIADRSASILEIYAGIKPPRPAHTVVAGNPAAGDEALLAKARAAKNGAEFSALYDDGEVPGGSHSEADFNLCMRLAWWFNHNPEAIDRVFRNSALMRPKWDEPRGQSTYGELTIAKASAAVEGAYSPESQYEESADSDEDEDDPTSGLKLPVTNPKRMAQLVLQHKYRHADHPTILYWRETWWTWKHAQWNVTDTVAVRNAITLVAEREFELLWARELAAFYKNNSDPKPEDAPTLKPVTQSFIVNVLGSLQAHARIDDAEQPCWLGVQPAPFPPDCTVPTRTALVSIGSGAHVDITPRFFSPYRLDFDYQPDAPEPAEWLKFLESLFGSDTESIELLQEWFGYCLTPDISQHKILLLTGPPRSGKGVIARTLYRLMGGAENVRWPTLASMSEHFGLQSLIGCPLAIFGDVRLDAKTEKKAVIVERLLTISGGDSINIPRKGISDWVGALIVRFLMISNETPWLTDASTAFANRCIAIRTTRSFLGREDRGLENRFEMPGVFNWSIMGWKRLRDRGHFVQPASGTKTVGALRQQSSPISTFVDEVLEVDPQLDTIPKGASTYREPQEYVRHAWEIWCQRNGHTKSGNKSTLSITHNLDSILPNVAADRTTKIKGELSIELAQKLGPTATPPKHKSVRLYTGIRLNEEYRHYVEATIQHLWRVGHAPNVEALTTLPPPSKFVEVSHSDASEEEATE